MVKAKVWSKRVLMTLLFVIAFNTTIQTVTGVSVEAMSKAYIEENKITQTSMHPLKFISIGLKSLKSAFSPQTEISASSEMKSDIPTLEEAFNWEEYPSSTVVATGYTAGYESTGKNPEDPSYGITYSGVKVKRDLYSTIAADLNIFPIGTILFIPDYGYGVVADTGSAIKGNKIDLYFETVEDVYNEWGKRTLEVYVVQKGNGSLTNEALLAMNEDEAVQVFRSQYGFKTKE